jgi:hypothetical protein
MVAIATQMPVQVAEPALVEALELPDPRARLAAAIGLAAMANPLGEEVLEAHLPTSVGREREAIGFALARLAEATWGPDYGHVIRVDQANSLIVFETKGKGVYLGQRGALRRKGRPIATLRIVRRRAQFPLAAASFEGDIALEPGDTVHALPERP